MIAEYCFQGLKNQQWDYCCHVLICMVKTMVRSLRFTLTDFKSANVICLIYMSTKLPSPLRDPITTPNQRQ